MIVRVLGTDYIGHGLYLCQYIPGKRSTPAVFAIHGTADSGTPCRNDAVGAERLPSLTILDVSV